MSKPDCLKDYDIKAYGDEVTLSFRAVNETGKQYGALTVLAPVKMNGQTSLYWHCKCSCGKDCVFKGCELRAGKRTSCGNRCNGAIDETGNKYAYLTVLKRDERPASEFPDRAIHWICKCELCGTVKSVSGKILRNGDAKSCGCLKSYGERLVTKALIELELPYKKEYTLPDLRGKKNSHYRFDFAIFDKENPDNLLFVIEFNGIQHFKPCMGKWNSSLKALQEADAIKEQYCIDNKINKLNFNNYFATASNRFYPEIKQEILNFYNNLTMNKKEHIYDVQVCDYDFGNLQS